MPHVVIISAKKERLDLTKRLYESLCVSYKVRDFRVTFSWVLVDDGSEDMEETALWLKNLHTPFPIAFITNAENVGVTRCRNKAIDYVRQFIKNYDFIYPIDVDDYVLPSWTSTFIGVYQKKGFDVCFVNEVKHRSRKFLNSFPAPQVADYGNLAYLYENMNEYDCIDGSMIFSREYIEGVDQFYPTIKGERWTSEYLMFLVRNPKIAYECTPMVCAEYQEDGMSNQWEQNRNSLTYQFNGILENFLLMDLLRKNERLYNKYKIEFEHYCQTLDRKECLERALCGVEDSLNLTLIHDKINEILNNEKPEQKIQPDLSSW